MKKSEFLDGLKRLISTEWYNIDAAGTLAEEAGVKWDPEEPELPKGVSLTWVAVDSDPCKPSRPILKLPGVRGRDLNRDEAFAVINAYNRLQSGELVEAQQLPEDTPERVGISWGVHAPDVAVLTAGGPEHRPLTLKEARGFVAGWHEASRELEAVTGERDELEGRLLTQRTISENLRLDLAAERDAKGAVVRERDQLRSDYDALWRDEQRLRAELSRIESATVIHVARGGTSTYYAAGPIRYSREEAARDLREWFDKEAS